MNPHSVRDYNGDRPIYGPDTYIHLFNALTKPKPTSLIQRLTAFIRRQVTITHNK